MKCDICKRELTADEPVWHFRPGHTIWRPGFRNEGAACEQCKTKPPKGAEWMFSEEAWQPRWGAARPCEYCRRLVFDRKPTRGAAFMCGPECRQAARYTRRRIAISARLCAQCRKSFLAKRNDVKFCSIACKQRAYRARRVTREGFGDNPVETKR